MVRVFAFFVRSCQLNRNIAVLNTSIEKRQVVKATAKLSKSRENCGRKSIVRRIYFSSNWLSDIKETSWGIMQ